MMNKGTFRLRACLAAMAAGLLLLALAAPALAQGMRVPVGSGILDLTPEEKAWLEAHPVIRVGLMDAWPPMDFVDEQGRAEGIGADFVRTLNGRLNGRLVMVSGPWAEIYEQAKNRELDAVMDITPRPDREEFFYFTQPYTVIPHVIVAREDSPYYRTLENLDGLVLALEKGYFLVGYVRENYPETTVLEYASTADALDAVAKGEADAYVGNRAVAVHIMERELLGNLRVRGKITESASINAIGVRKDWPQLATILNKGLESMTRDEVRTILRRWGGQDEMKPDEGPELSLTRLEREWIRAHPVIRVGAEAAWAPVEFLDESGQFQGISVDYLGRVHEMTGLRFEFASPAPRAEALEMLSGRDLDMLSAADTAPDREGNSLCTRPYLILPAAIFSLDDGPYYAGLQDLDGLKAAVVKGFPAWEELRVNHPEVALLPVDTVSQGLALVQSKKADVFVGNMLTTSELIRAEGHANLKVSGQTGLEYPLGFAVRKDWPQLADILQKTLDAIGQEERNDIYKRWVGLTVKRTMDYGLLWKILAAALIVLAGVMFWNRRLAAEIRRRVEAETRLKKLSGALEHTRAMCVITDRDGVMEYVNPGFTHQTGFTAEEALGRKPSMLSSGRHSPEFYRAMWATLLEGGIWRGEIRNKRKNGELFWQSVVISPILDEQGGITHYVSLQQDITPRKETEAELKKLSRALEQSPASVVITDTDGNITYVNPKFCEVTGYTQKEALGQNPRILSSGRHPEKFYRELWETITSGNVWHGEFENKKKNGELYWESATVSPIRNQDGEITHFVAVKEDITDRKRIRADLERRVKELDEARLAMLNMMEDLEAARREAEDATQAKGEFLANMSHEIRTPMNAILGMTHLALKTELTPKQEDYLRKSDAAAKSLLGLINDILDFSKIEAGKLDMEAVELSLEEVMRSATDLALETATGKGLELLLRMDPEVPRRMVGDPLRLKQVLVNLVGNAVKFTEQGEVLLDCRLQEQNENSAVLAFSVSDTGIGMTRKQQKRLFQAFTQGDSSTTREFGGTGLGLTICKHLVNLMGGEIGFTSQAGKGSTFHFTARLGKADEQAEPEIPPVTKDLHNLKVLVVDDNNSAREIFSAYLETMGFRPETVGSGEKALDILLRDQDKDPFQLVILDWLMAGLDGLETARAIRTHPRLKPSPTLAMATAYGREDVREQARDVGISVFMDKPVTQSTLLDSILRAFGHATARRTSSRDSQDHLETIRHIRGARILLAEDNAINQQVATEILQSAGCLVDVASNGRQAVEMAAANAYDAVLMDIQMPVMDGFAATKAILSQQTGAPPIIAMTAHAMAGDREKSLQAGMRDHVSKPIDPQMFLTVLAHHIPPDPDRAAQAAGLSEDAPGDMPPLPDSLPGINIKAGLTRLGGNSRLYLKLLSQFRHGQANAPEDLRRHLAEGDDGTALRVAHTIKGVAANLGASELSKLAAAIELDIKKKQPGVESRLPEFEQSLHQAFASIDSVLPEEVNNGQMHELTPEIMREAAALAGEVALYLKTDYLEASKRFESLSGLLRGTQYNETVRILQDHLDIFDVDRALEVLRTLEKTLA